MKPLLWPLLALLQLLRPRPAVAEQAAATDTEQASYWLETEPRQWWAAGLACQRAGGHLAVPRSREEAVQLAALQNSSAASTNWAFVGYNDLAEERQFLSVTGVELWASGYEQWHPWNAAAGPHDHCLVLDRYALYWDVPCDWRLSSLCEMEPALPTPCPTYEAEDVENVENEENEEDTTMGARPYRENTITLETQRQRWVAALAHCQRTGRRLAVTGFGPDNAELGDLMETLARGDSDIDAAFIGVSDLAQAGTFVTILGDPFVPRDAEAWNASLEAAAASAATGDAGAAAAVSASGVGGHSCVVVDGRGLYRPVPCVEELAFVCEATPEAREAECPPPTPPPTEAADAPPPPGRIVLQWREPRRWADADRQCLLMGGVLATAQTRGEARAMAAMLRNVPRPSDADIGLDIWAFVGARDNSQEGNFTNIFGAQLPAEEEAAAWGPGQPNGGVEQNCVVLDRVATLWDMPCDRLHAFFCRRLPRLPPWATNFQGDRSQSRWAKLMSDAVSSWPDPEFAGVDWRPWADKLRSRALAQPRAEPSEPRAPNTPRATRTRKNQRVKRTL